MRTVGARRLGARMAWPLYALWVIAWNAVMAGCGYAGAMFMGFALINVGLYPDLNNQQRFAKAGESVGGIGLAFMVFATFVSAVVVLMRVLRGRKVDTVI